MIHPVDNCCTSRNEREGYVYDRRRKSSYEYHLQCDEEQGKTVAAVHQGMKEKDMYMILRRKSSYRSHLQCKEGQGKTVAAVYHQMKEGDTI